LYAGQHERKRIVAFSSAGTESVIAEGIQTHHLTVTSRNDIYFTEAPTHKVWLVDAAGRKHVVHERMDWPRGVRASTDESLLLVNDPRTNWIWSFLIQNDGSLINGRPTYHLGSKTDAGGMTFDSEGFLYVATKFGVPGNRPAGPGDGHHRRARERGPIQCVVRRSRPSVAVCYGRRQSLSTVCQAAWCRGVSPNVAAAVVTGPGSAGDLVAGWATIAQARASRKIFERPPGESTSPPAKREPGQERGSGIELQNNAAGR